MTRKSKQFPLGVLTASTRRGGWQFPHSGWAMVVPAALLILAGPVSAQQTMCEMCHQIEVITGNERNWVHMFPEGDGSHARECEGHPDFQGGGHGDCHEFAEDGDCNTHDGCQALAQAALEDVRALVKHLQVARFVAGGDTESEIDFGVMSALLRPASRPFGRLEASTYVEVARDGRYIQVMSCQGVVVESWRLTPRTARLLLTLRDQRVAALG